MDTTSRNWFDSSVNCNSKGGYLGSIHSLEQNRWVYEFIRASGYSGSDIWIGMNDISQEGSMVWLDGSNSSYTFFSATDTRNYGSYEHCVIYWNNKNGAWADTVCTAGLKGLCKYNGTVSLNSPGKQYSKFIILAPSVYYEFEVSL